jgi:nucleotide-binding universal stress UspA family protein
MRERQGVLVGVDGSVGSRRAVTWAAAEAASRSEPLRLCWCVPASAPAGELSRDGGPRSTQETARTALQGIAARVRRDWPGLTVRAELVGSAPAAGLLRGSRTARLLVVGSRGRGILQELLLGSVSHLVVQNASSPVVVVPAATGDADGPVLVGVDGSTANEDAVQFALETADRWGVGVRALSAVDARAAAPSRGFAAIPELDHAVELAREALRPWAEKFPHVVVTESVVFGPPQAELVRASSDASLTVVGSRGRGGLSALLLGSVSQHVVRHAHGPVAVVRRRSG